MLLLSVLMLASGCMSQGGSIVLPENSSIDDLDIVDCSLPGQVRQIGRSMIYETPRRMVRTTRAECGLRGGEMLVYDRADPASAIEHWLAPAQRGDVDAQFYLGQLYEGRAGLPPNYERAAYWYRRAAENGHRAAQTSLGVLLEKGLGVEKDLLAAIEWYRKASGLELGELVFSSETSAELDALRSRLEDRVATANRQIESLEARVRELEGALDAERATDEAARREVEDLKALLAGLEDERAEDQRVLVRLATVDRDQTPEDRAELGVAALREFRGEELGRYYALVIGNRNYVELDDLVTPIADAKRVSALLASKYGFAVTTLLDADQAELKRAINDLDEITRPEDNVLIYFAGHGVLSEAGARISGARRHGYWLPVNAEPNQDTFWVDNWWVTDHLARNDARRIVVVADSCYAGLFSNDTSILLSGDASLPEDEIIERLSRRTRYVLSSGDVKPVLDGGGDGHSLFAQAFIDVLEANRGLLTLTELYGKLFERVAEGAKELGLEQLPQLRPIRPAGHEWGGFYFLPVP